MDRGAESRFRFEGATTFEREPDSFLSIGQRYFDRLFESKCYVSWYDDGSVRDCFVNGILESY